MKKFRFNIQSIVFTWLLSYISVLLIPIVISFAIYYCTENVIKNEIYYSNHVLIQQVQQIADDNMRDIQKLETQIELDNNLQQVANVNGALEGSDRYIINKQVTNFKTFKIANSFIDDIFVYLNNQDSFITTNTYYDSGILNEPSLQSMGINYRELAEILIDTKDTHVFICPGTVNKTLVYSKPIISVISYKAVATVVFLIDASKLLQAVEKIKLPNEGIILVLDSNNKIIASTENLGFDPTLKYDEFKQEYGIKDYKMNGKIFTVSNIRSDLMQWKYISVIPSDVFTKKVDTVRKFTYISLIISIIIGGFISFLFTKKNYNPINKLVQKLAVASDITLETRHNEYNFIENAIDSTVSSNEWMDDCLFKQNNVILSNYIKKLLKGKISDDIPISYILSPYDLKFISEEFAVMLFYIESCSNTISSDENQSLIQFAIKNVVEELINPKHRGYVVESNDIMVCLVNFSSNGGKIDDIIQIAKETMTFMDENFQIRVSISISQIHNGLHGIHEAYNESIEIMGYRLLVGNGKILQYENILKYKLSNENYNYPIEIEQQMVNYIKAGDLEKSQQLLNDIYDKNFMNGYLSVSLARCLIFDLVSTILKTLDEIKMFKDGQLQEELKSVNRIVGCDTVMDMKREMNDILTRVCTYIRQDKKLSGNKVITDITDYVREHYMDEDLNVSQIADKFKMNLSYISKQFKKQNGDGLYDYINKIRVENAKHLLKENNNSICNIAKHVGYYSENSFIRVFKKYEGVTPGKFKEINAYQKY